MTNTNKDNIKEGGNTPSPSELEETIGKVFEEQYKDLRKKFLIEFPNAYELVKAAGRLIKEGLEFKTENPRSIEITRYVKKRLDKLGLKYDYIEIIQNKRLVLQNEDYEKYESKWKELEDKYEIKVSKFFNMPGFTFREGWR